MVSVQEGPELTFVPRRPRTWRPPGPWEAAPPPARGFREAETEPRTGLVLPPPSVSPAAPAWACAPAAGVTYLGYWVPIARLRGDQAAAEQVSGRRALAGLPLLS